MNTPWGKSDSINKIQKGVSWVGTPSHGGFMITRKAAETFLSPAAIKRAEPYGKNYLAFEEDCLFALVVWEHVNDVWAESYLNEKFGVQAYFECISRWNPEYLIERGTQPAAKQYAEWLEDQEIDRLRAAKSPDLIVSASGDWAAWVPKDMVGITTADDARYLVWATDYPRLGYRLSSYPQVKVL